MYVPDHFREDRVPVLHDAIRRIGFGTLVTLDDDGIEANHVPMLLDAEAGILRGHLARANPQARSLRPGAQALAIFLGPHAYVSPSWYPSKVETGKAVPTWNFIAVHAQGTIVRQQDAAWLRAHVAALTEVHEAARATPWSLADAPSDYLDGMLRAIIGFELAVTRLDGKWKLSQNRSPADIAGVRDGLLREGGEAQATLAALMAGI
ncbi:MAG TPA: FMN-binding negative transcriptional regulator [Rhizomicrobium sp.]|jgi:transcriptional regulator|nr:FMN-binding negative transcriptional regulator [Rhizomicrobium sp.]